MKLRVINHSATVFMLAENAGKALVEQKMFGFVNMVGVYGLGKNIFNTVESDN